MIVQRYYLNDFYSGTITNMEPILTTTATGFLLSADNVTYVMERVGEMLKVTGPDTCYYLLETARGLEQANCALTTFSVLLGN